jgi:16S rRNA (cytosine967-C5)-methyltransferase
VKAEVSPTRRAAYEVLRRVFEHGAWADRALPAAATRHRLDRRERSQAQRLAYGAVQRRGTADHLIEALAGRPIARLDPPVLAALRLGLFELLHSDSVPGHAAVDQAVELAKSAVAARRPAGAGRATAAAGLVNAVLRRAARERSTLLASIEDSTPRGAAVLHSYPEWLAAMWWEELGADGARSLMAAMNEPAETCLRVNALIADPALLAAELIGAEGSVGRPTAAAPLAPPEALVVDGPLTDGLRRRIARGELVAQARASQAVVSLLDPRPGQRVLDLCAAPGIKTTAIAARLGNRGEIVAVEVDPGRARQLRELCERLGATCVRVVEGDAARVDISGGYDRILVDPPCSDLGTLNSRPDARWRKSPALIERLAQIQRTILAHAAGALDDRGTLLYSTCTISARENESRVAELAERDSTLRADDLGASYPELAARLDRRCLQTRPDRDRTDGFFVARLRRGRAPAGGGG